MSDKRPSQSEDMSDKALSELYRQAPAAKSPASLDDKVLARAAEQADRIHHTSRYAEVRRPVFLARQWVTLAATACVITLSISLVIQMPEDQPWLDSRIEESESIVIAERKQVQPAMKSRAADAASTPTPTPVQTPTQQAPKRELLEEVVVSPSAFSDALSQEQEYDQEAPQKAHQGIPEASPAPAFTRSLPQSKSLEKSEPAEPQWQPQQWLAEVVALWQREKQQEARALFNRYKEAFPSEATLQHALQQSSQLMTQQEQAIIHQLQLQWQQEQQGSDQKLDQKQ
jgi:hypothetical protein